MGRRRGMCRGEPWPQLVDYRSIELLRSSQGRLRVCTAGQNSSNPEGIAPSRALKMFHRPDATMEICSTSRAESILDEELDC